VRQPLRLFAGRRAGLRAVAVARLVGIPAVSRSMAELDVTNGFIASSVPFT
jgi:hypothetical protein